jgi:hypothetical protein
MRFLSGEWLRELVNAFDSGEIKDVDVVIQQVVKDGPEGEVSYWLAFKDGDVTGEIGAAQSPDVALTMDHTTAKDLAQGEINAQAAFMQGRLKVTGNMGKLLQNQAAIAALGPAMATLRTDY